MLISSVKTKTGKTAIAFSISRKMFHKTYNGIFYIIISQQKPPRRIIDSAPAKDRREKSWGLIEIEMEITFRESHLGHESSDSSVLAPAIAATLK